MWACYSCIICFSAFFGTFTFLQQMNTLVARSNCYICRAPFLPEAPEAGVPQKGVVSAQAMLQHVVKEVKKSMAFVVPPPPPLRRTLPQRTRFFFSSLLTPVPPSLPPSPVPPPSPP